MSFAHVRELLDLIIRWVHLIAGIMWIGNSLLFNWLDRNLERPEGSPEGFEGRIWMVHSGGFYDVVKKQLEPGQLPEHLHWFKWQNFTTWASGIFLLIVVYYLGGAALMIDPSVRALDPVPAIGIGVSAIVLAWVTYDVLCRVLIQRSVIFGVLGFALLGGLAFGLSQLLSGRAAYMHVGVVLGTVMTGNVWTVIVPSQRELVGAIKEGRAQDPALGKRAKQRSVHNNYMTFPLLFIMISNHFPSTYGNQLNWIVLGVLMVSGALVRHFMNIRFVYRAWMTGATATILAAVVALFVLTKPKADARAADAPRVSSAEVQAIVARRCTPCHSEAPSDDVFRVAPSGVKLQTLDQLRALAPRLKERAFNQRTMPLANKTQMTDDERARLAAWVDQGAVD
ncbi:MAG: urate hydroxylase PuuD [Deltaproteobacteria bacterium]|nr:urate hydroxylase PuuD [Deltaproteobacteria bacterium]